MISFPSGATSGSNLFGAFNIAAAAMSISTAKADNSAADIVALTTASNQGQRADMVDLIDDEADEGGELENEHHNKIDAESPGGISSEEIAAGEENIGNGGDGQRGSVADVFFAMKEAGLTYRADAMVIKTASQLIGTLIDVVDDANDHARRRGEQSQ